MKTLTKKDVAIYAPCTIALGNGLTLAINTQPDESAGAPWEESDGHGPVSDWTTRDKLPGEREIHSDRRSKRYYDFAEAVKLARKDRWDAAPYHAAFPDETKGQQAVRAAEADFKFLRSWCADEWNYIGVLVTLCDASGRELAHDALWGVESNGDYWREVAAEMGNTLITGHAAEVKERAHWEARDTATIGGTP